MSSLKLSDEFVRNLSIGQLLALLNKVSGGDPEKIKSLLADHVQVELVDKILKLVDKNGRVIPPSGLQSSVCDPDKDYYLFQPDTIDYLERLEIFNKYFQVKKTKQITVSEFEDRVEKARQNVLQNEQIANFEKGVTLPFFIPQMDILGDIGKGIDERFISAIQASYETNFTNKKFCNYNKKLSGKVEAVRESRQSDLLEKLAKDNIVGVLYVVPLQGFSINAQREIMELVPEFLYLSGLECLAGYIGYPDVLTRDYYTPVLELSGLSFGSSSVLFLCTADDVLEFDSYGALVLARDFCSGGFSVFG